MRPDVQVRPMPQREALLVPLQQIGLPLVDERQCLSKGREWRRINNGRQGTLILIEARQDILAAAEGAFGGLAAAASSRRTKAFLKPGRDTQCCPRLSKT